MRQLIGSLRHRYRRAKLRDLHLYRQPYHRPLDDLDERIAIWRRIIFDKRLRAAYDRAAASIDREAFRALQAKYRERIEAGEFEGTAKYLDLAPWLRLHAGIAIELDLDRRPPCRILDLGAGGGQFLAIARCYGHEVTAFDVPGREIYADLLALFGIPLIEGRVDLGEALPEATGRHDIITVNGQVFDIHKGSGRRWEVDDWAAWLDHLSRHHLRYPGEIFVGLNKSAGLTGTEDYLWPLVEFARSRGAKVVAGKPRFRLALDGPLSSAAEA